MMRTIALLAARCPAVKAGVALVVGLFCVSAYGRDPVVWRWHEPNTELYDPVFAPSGAALALVRQLHWPDGHEAESIPESELLKLQRRTAKEPRFADPVVVTLGFRQEVPVVVDWGWNPAFSPDGARIAYAFQKKPISGFRRLAESLAGNEIRVADTKTRSHRTLATPTSGYLETPVFSPDGGQVAYLLSGPVNGAYGGGIGVGRAPVEGGAAEVLYPPSRTAGLYHLVSPPRFAGKRLLAIRGIPGEVMEGNPYVANTYKVDLLDFAAQNAVAYSWGTLPLVQYASAQFTVTGSDKVLVHDKGWLVLTPLRSAPFAGHAAGFAGMLSPDERLLAEVSGEVLTIGEVATGKVRHKVELPGEFRQMTWSHDARRLAVVVTKLKDADALVFAYDELLVLEPQ